MQPMSLACFLSVIRPPGIQFEEAVLQILPVDKAKCPFVRDKNDIEFRLFTRHNPTVYQELRVDDDEALFASHFNFHDPTVFYFGAFMETPDDGSGLRIRQAYMLKGDTNFIVLDINRLEAGPWYFTAAENTWYIGNFAAMFIDYMVSRGLNLNTTHLIGHSLGAQSAGVAGHAIKSGRVSRITGLDPALPLFNGLPLSQRLDPGDAEFVDVIHTDAGIFGYKASIGHVDFFPNGGISPQPGCELEVVLHEQRFLNKCDENVQPQGYLLFDLTTNKQPHKPTFIDKLLQFFTYINSLYNSDAEASETVNIKDVDDYNKSSPKLAGARKDKLSKYTNGNKNKEISHKSTLINKIRRIDNANKDDLTRINITKGNNEETQTNIEDIAKVDNSNENSEYDTPYKREKRISVHDNNKNSTDEVAIENRDEIMNDSSKTDDKHDKFSSTDTTDSTGTIKPDTDENITHQDINPINNFNFEEITTDQETITAIKPTPSKSNKTLHETKRQRQKRFISLFKNNENDNFLFRMLEFLVKNRKSVVPVVTVMREINTLVKSANGELSHFAKERNNYIGGLPNLTPVKYDLELGETGIVSFVKKLLGIAPKGGRLSITGSK